MRKVDFIGGFFFQADESLMIRRVIVETNVILSTGSTFHSLALRPWIEMPQKSGCSVRTRKAHCPFSPRE